MYKFRHSLHWSYLQTVYPQFHGGVFHRYLIGVQKNVPANLHECLKDFKHSRKCTHLLSYNIY